MTQTEELKVGMNIEHELLFHVLIDDGLDD